MESIGGHADKDDIERRLKSLEQALGELSKTWTAATSQVAKPGAAFNKLDCFQFAVKLQRFSESLEPREQRDLVRLLAPAIQAAEVAAKNPTKERHKVPAAFLREVDAKLARGTINVGGVVGLGPTITVTTITTTIASHPIIGCNGDDPEPPI